MKKYCGGILIAVTLLASAPQAPAIVGLNITVQSTNIVLSWPSTGVETYLIQYRSTLNTNDAWINVTNNYPAAANSNRTTFVIYGAVPPPSTNGSGGGAGWTDPPEPGGDSVTVGTA